METEKNKTDETTSPEKGKKKGSRKAIYLGLGALVLGALSYFGWDYWKKHASADDLIKDSDTNFDDKSSANKTPHSSPKPKNPNPKTAHTSQGTKKQSSVNENKNTNAKTPNDNTAHTEEKLDAANIAYQLVQSTNSKSYLKTITLLNSLKTVRDYNAVSTVYKTYRVNNVHQTLVNGLLSTFTDAKQKPAIKAEFLRIGLKHNVQTDKWSLSGTVNSPILITISPAQVWKSSKRSVSVPPNMILGHEVAKRGTYTVFENEQEYYLVQSARTAYYRP